MVADMTVVNAVYEAKKIYEQEGRMPNFAIMGGPGTGKSTLAKRIAKCFLISEYSDDKFLYKSTSDLKGAYVGHTGARMFKLIKDAAEREQIIFIDEAYNMQNDAFGKEALEICLPLLTGDRDKIEAPALGQSTQGETYSFKDEGKKVPPIWLAGYEHEMRKMLSQNPGLYRRMIKLTLPSPTVDGLYDCLKEKCNDIFLKETFEKNKEIIRNYFDWATSRENVDYFGNYAGVNEFFTTCRLRISSSDSDDIATETINQIIDEKKKEIKKQYKSILEDIQKIKFEVQHDIDVVLDDVRGNENTVKSLRAIVKMMMNQEEYIKKGIKLPKGALLVGPPGTGKTMLARAVAGEIQKQCREKEKKDVQIAFIATIATELNSTEKISALFSEASEYDLSIIFIDEIDAIGKHRNMHGATPELLIQLMKELDGFEIRKNIFVMAATNDPNSLDPALKRPGRFDKVIEVTYPNSQGREEILKSAILKLELFNNNAAAAEELAKKLAKKTRQYAPANLINLVNEAAILYEECEECEKSNICDIPHRKNLILPATSIEKFECDINETLERLAVGEANSFEKEETFQAAENKGCSAVAVHEVGHAVISLLLNVKPFESVTILPRGNTLGYVVQNYTNQLITKRDYLNQIRICLGGRAAEEILYGDNISTGAVQDIQQATMYAENMVTLFGMSETIGMMALKTPSTGYLGNMSQYSCSDSFRFEADDTIRKLLCEQMTITRHMLEKRKDEIIQMAEYIFNKEIVTGNEFKEKFESLNEEK